MTTMILANDVEKTIEYVHWETLTTFGRALVTSRMKMIMNSRVDLKKEIGFFGIIK